MPGLMFLLVQATPKCLLHRKHPVLEAIFTEIICEILRPAGRDGRKAPRAELSSTCAVKIGQDTFDRQLHLCCSRSGQKQPARITIICRAKNLIRIELAHRA